MDWNVVHVRVNHAITGKPTPVRVRFTTPDGAYLPPLGRPAEVSTSPQAIGGSVLLQGKQHAYVEGSFEIRLPVGSLNVAIDKGPAYVPVRQTIVRRMGQIALRLAIEPRADGMEGWYGGDVAAHFLSPAAAGLEGAAEGLHFVNVLAFQREDGTFPNLLDFSGQQPALSRDQCNVVVNTLNDGAAAGQLYLLNCHRIVYPLRLGAPGFEKYGLTDWCQQCHRKGGLVLRPWEQSLAPDDEVWNQIDGIAWTPQAGDVNACLQRWYELLNAGKRIALTGGSGKTGNGTPLGVIRTYAKLPPEQEPTYGNWIDAIRLGRTCATSGPFLTFECCGKEPGSTLRDSEVTNGVLIKATGRWAPPGATCEVVVDGKVVEQVRTDEHGKIEINQPMPSPRRWMAWRCMMDGTLLAHAGPVYVTRASA